MLIIFEIFKLFDIFIIVHFSNMFENVKFVKMFRSFKLFFILGKYFNISSLEVVRVCVNYLRTCNFYRSNNGTW